ncbi:UDP-glucosyltransferase 2-like [Aricia agestis]|uniref:UDP-glucosyltransferase 2-like n=1 Tax=Aricia agestis TaxID=91739 RepID=UPI001C2054C4|nr:UDP-glucosyltransferase 2-like [Aricia agestis]
MFGGTLCSYVFLLVIYLTLETESARILAFFPTPSISHQIVFRPLTHELARRGHEVTVVTTDPYFPKGKSPPNLTEIDVHDISYSNWAEVLTNHNMGEKNSIMKQIEFFFKRFATTLDLQLQTAEVQEILKKDRKYYDLLILEACIRPLMGIAHVFDAPIILFSSFGAVAKQYSGFGSPMHPLLFPTPGRQRLYNLSFWEKGFELFKHVMLEYLISTTEPFDHEIMQKHFGKDVPRIGTYKDKMKMMFINEHPIWNDNRPVGPNILFVGGIHQSTVKELPDDLKKYLDSSKHGVIFMSFGTNVLASALPRDKITAITKVFSQLPYDVILKWDLDELPGKPDNVRLTKWIPQPDMLKHPNIKLFITQGGLQSTDEAIDAAVPLIGIPMLGDQWYNVEKYVKHNIGLQLDIHTLTEDKFKQAIETVIKDPSYKQNITKLRSLMRSVPIKPLDQAVFWVEHILEHGGDHLQPPSIGVSFTEYYEVKLVLVLLGILVSILLALAFIIRAIVNKIYKKFTISVKIKHN